MGYRVAVVAGGRSAEESEAALAAGGQAIQALECAGHEAELVAAGPGLAAALLAGRHQVALPVLEGPWGRGGEAQAVFESLGIPHVGSSRAALRRLGSLTGLAEAVSAAVARTDSSFGTPPLLGLAAEAVRSLGLAGQDVLGAAVEARLPGGFPAAVVRDEAWRWDAPVVARDASELEEAASALGESGQDCAVLAHGETVELAACVLGDEEDALVLPAARAVREGGDSPRWDVPVPTACLSPSLPDAEAIRSEVERCALETFVSLGIRDLACVRMLWDGGRVLVAGLDLAPSLSEGGLLRASASAAGVALPDVLDALVSDAAERG